MTDSAKYTLKQLSFHLRGLADAIEQLGGEQKAESPVENPALDDVVPWGKYPKRLASIPVRFRWMIEGDARCERRETTSSDYDISTFRKLLRHGRYQLLRTRNVGETTIKTLDDEFAARNCPEWLTS